MNMATIQTALRLDEELTREVFEVIKKKKNEGIYFNKTQAIKYLIMQGIIRVNDEE